MDRMTLCAKLCRQRSRRDASQSRHCECDVLALHSLWSTPMNAFSLYNPCDQAPQALFPSHRRSERHVVLASLPASLALYYGARGTVADVIQSHGARRPHLRVPRSRTRDSRGSCWVYSSPLSLSTIHMSMEDPGWWSIFSMCFSRAWVDAEMSTCLKSLTSFVHST